MPKERIVIVDDDEYMREGMVETLSSSPYEIVSYANGKDSLEAIADGGASLLITDMRMPEMDGMELLAQALRLDPKLPVIMMTAYASVETAVEAMKIGAFDYIIKPFEADQVDIIVSKALEHRRLLAENEYLKGELAKKFKLEYFVGQSQKMKDEMDKIRQVASSNATVFIRGESGTGKELAARAIHAQSTRRDKRMVCVNCAALSAGVLESELFGHEKGAFTGADKRRIGRFEMADGGTIFLDEVSEMDLGLQGKLLRVLQEKEFERVGSSETISADVRIIASSNRDLEKTIAEGLFRQDLYYRLNVISVELPPLRERKGDVRILANYFVEKYNREEGRHITGIAEDALCILDSYTWPGNVRELENIIERAIVLNTGEIIEAKHISTGLENNPGAALSDTQAGPFEPKPLDEIEREHVMRVLRYHSEHRQKTADSLGISERSLRDRLKRWQEKGFIKM